MTWVARWYSSYHCRLTAKRFWDRTAGQLGSSHVLSVTNWVSFRCSGFLAKDRLDRQATLNCSEVWMTDRRFNHLLKKSNIYKANYFSHIVYFLMVIIRKKKKIRSRHCPLQWQKTHCCKMSTTEIFFL